MKPLPILIPYDLADVLETDPTNICHINKGRRQLRIDKCIRLMEIAGEDSRLTGLCFIHLRPELEPALPYLFPKRRNRVPRAGGIKEGQGPPQSQILRPAPDQGSRPLGLKEDTETLAKIYEIEVEDQSLMPSYPPGTLLTAQQDTADLIKNGNLVVYWAEDGKTYIRQIFLNQDHIVLRSLTQGLSDKILPAKHIALCEKILRIEFPA